MARVKVVDAQGNVRMLAEKLANDATYMAQQGLTKQVAKKVVEEKKEAPKKAVKKTTAKK
jgi:hypothetical protein